MEYDYSTLTMVEIPEPAIVYEGDTQYLKLTLTALNEGTDTAFNAKFDLGVEPNTRYVPREETSKYLIYIDNGVIEEERRITIIYQGKIVAGDKLKFDVYLVGKEGPTVEYRVYYPLGDDKRTLEPLSLTNCEGSPVH